MQRRPSAVVATVVALTAIVAVATVSSAPAAGKPRATLFAAARDGNQIAVAVNVAGFKLLPKQIGKKTNVAGGGHYHIMVKGPGTGGKFVYAGASGGTTGTTGGAAAPDFEAKPGSYQVRVDLANNDHSPLKPGAPSNVVKLASISLSAASVVTVKDKGKESQQVRVTVAVKGMTMAPGKIGKAPAPGQGHYHVLVDGAYAGASAGRTATTGGKAAPDFVLKPGSHEVTVVLALNNHTQIGAASNAVSVGG